MIRPPGPPMIALMDGTAPDLDAVAERVTRQRTAVDHTRANLDRALAAGDPNRAVYWAAHLAAEVAKWADAMRLLPETEGDDGLF